MLSASSKFLGRVGGVLVRPRATWASLEPDEGRRDGLWLGGLYLVGSHVLPLLEAVATLLAVRNWNGLLMLAATLGMALLAPIFASIVAETILGADRTRPTGLCIAPLVVVSLAAHGAVRLGLSVPGPSWVPAALGILGTAAVAVAVRRAPTERPETGSSSRVARVLGGVVVTASLALGGIDAGRGLSAWSSLGPLPPGERVASFRVVTLEGEVLSAADLEGRVSVVTFWATWCGACVSELPELDALAHRYDDERVRFLAVNREGGGLTLVQTVAIVRRFAHDRNLTLPFAVDDGSMAQAFRVGPIPHTIVFDRAGVVRHVHQGRVGASTLETEIESLLRRPE